MGVLHVYEQIAVARQPEALPAVLRHLYRMTGYLRHTPRRAAYVRVFAMPSGPDPDAPLMLHAAQESGIEGIACVDDTARAAILAFQAHEQTGSSAALALAEEWPGFVAYMQEPDGRFANFIYDADGRKNRTGPTSYIGGDWWTARALWALATGWRVTGDPRYLAAFRRTPLVPSRHLKVLGIQILALLELYRSEPSAALSAQILARCDTIVRSGPGYFRDAQNRRAVGSWGYRQLQAVARAARLLDRPDYTPPCVATVRNLIVPLIQGGFYHVYPNERDHRCAYDLSPLVLGLEEMYRLTGAANMRRTALTCASWLDGRNPASVALYDPRTGRCADGITGGEVSAHCGAESAIEAGFIHLARRRLQVWPAGAPIASR